MSFHYGRDYHKAISTAGETGLDKRWRYPRQRILEFSQGGALLDIGCSTGGFLRTLAGPVWDLYGIEVSPTEAQKAKTSSGARVFVGDILDAPFAASTFDVITGFHVLEHVYRPKEIVGKLWNWLKPGGILYLHVPNIESLEASIFRSYWYGLELPRHLYHFSPASLDRLFTFFDFEKLLFRTLSHNHIEASMHYVLEELQAKFDISRTPLSGVHETPGVIWRIIRKALRLGFLVPFGCLAAAMGRGAGIEVAFRKRLS